MAWGSATATLDAFLTGKVAVSPDRKTTTLTLECFDKSSPATLRKLGTFRAATDRFVLRDLGYSFNVRGRGRAVRKTSLAREDMNIREEVNDNDPPPAGEEEKEKEP